MTALEIAVAFFYERHSSAQVAFLGGSAARGEATLNSDLDVVVLYEKLRFGLRSRCAYLFWCRDISGRSCRSVRCRKRV